MHLRSGHILGSEVAPEDSASNVDLEAILGPSLSARERSSLNSTSSVLGPLFKYESPTAKDNHGTRNRSIAIAKLTTKFQGEGDPITYVERFEQVCATFEDVSDGDKIEAFEI